MDRDKVLHQDLLADIRSSVSQHTLWRKRLFESNEHVKLCITSESIRDVFESLANKIDSNNLQFIVEKVPASESGFTVKAPMDVVFKFYPQKYPELIKYSFNNSVAG